MSLLCTINFIKLSREPKANATGGTYYAVASKRFVNNICMQATGYYASRVDFSRPTTSAAEERDPGSGKWSKDYDVDLVQRIRATKYATGT
ncbi:hypothetical protein VN97_g197 [Penicillium thymicola]|uniref:Uncharacterized protein n=1 Tax=Penicillium thymicola TaxID=293382 RepID=A0AAI9TTA5_PENTH|nr:hypothetical protein VN97_g197 [Penicillium thymicola]